MDSIKRGLIIGMTLGDGYVQVRKRLTKGKYPFEQRSLRVLHSMQQKAYCEWKASRLSWALDGRNINVTEVRNGLGGAHRAAQFTVSHPYFGQVRRWLYPDGTKAFSRRALDMLTPEGLAIWYMDDGSARRNINKDGWVSSVATDIATMCSEAEANTIVEWLLDTYGIKFNVRCRKQSPKSKAFYIQGNTEASKEFVGVVHKYVPESMLYKIAHVSQLISHERQAPIGCCSKCDSVIYDKRRKGMCVRCYTRELNR